MRMQVCELAAFLNQPGATYLYSVSEHGEAVMELAFLKYRSTLFALSVLAVVGALSGFATGAQKGGKPQSFRIRRAYNPK